MRVERHAPVGRAVAVVGGEGSEGVLRCSVRSVAVGGQSGVGALRDEVGERCGGVVFAAHDARPAPDMLEVAAVHDAPDAAECVQAGNKGIVSVAVHQRERNAGD